jgi:hypothetical protein
VQRVASVSHVAVLPDDAKAAVLEEVRTVLREHPATREQPLVALRYRVDCFALPKV